MLIFKGCVDTVEELPKDIITPGAVFLVRKENRFYTHEIFGYRACDLHLDKFSKSFDNPVATIMGPIERTWLTGDDECDAYSRLYECGGIYHHNYMDRLGNRDHDCFWDCKRCKYMKNETAIGE